MPLTYWAAGKLVEGDHRPNKTRTDTRHPRVSIEEDGTRERCYQCFRPKSLCFCDAIPRIDNRTNVLILQHVGEQSHPFNTARIVHRALRRCDLVVDHNQRLGEHHLPIQENAALLYPSVTAPSLTELPESAKPSQLVIIDGTWHQAKSIVRDVPQLRSLPCYRLAPSSPGQYRIRREPNAFSLSTLEATAAALRTLEPDTVGLDQLLSAFNKMVEDQLKYPATYAAWRKKTKRHSRPRDLPRALFQNPESLVVAYGEATSRQPGQRVSKRLPVSWVAQRLGTAERFSCLLQQDRPIAEAALQHMRLSPSDFAEAASHGEFRARWNHFLRRNDTLIVYHPRTYQLLLHIETKQPRCLALKSIFGKRRAGFRSLEELLAIEGLAVPPTEGNCRADQRLDMAVALVGQLRKRVHNGHGC